MRQEDHKFKLPGLQSDWVASLEKLMTTDKIDSEKEGKRSKGQVFPYRVQGPRTNAQYWKNSQ